MMDTFTEAHLDELSEDELEALELQLNRLLSVWEICNLRGQAAIFHDDQHIGEPRRELHAVEHPSVDLEALTAFRMKPVVDSLQGNTLVHPLATPIVEVDERNELARAVWWSLGVEGLSKFREQPRAIISLGMVPGTHQRIDGQWKILAGAWQRTTKNDYHLGWVRNMIPTNTRPPLTEEEDRNWLGKYAYRPDEQRQACPEPPRPDTWVTHPVDIDLSWMYINLE